MFVTGVRINRAYLLAQQGQPEEAILPLCQGLAAFQSIEMEITYPSLQALLAEVYGKARQAEEGLSALAEALAQVERTGEQLHEAELYRLKGELTLQQLKIKNEELKITETKEQGQKIRPPGPQPLAPNTQVEGEQEAEECFRKAIDIARQQQAKSWELRATMSLARLWQSQGKRQEAYKMLSEIYHWFTEGFDTKDLQEAQAVLTD